LLAKELETCKLQGILLGYLKINRHKAGTHKRLDNRDGAKGKVNANAPFFKKKGHLTINVFSQLQTQMRALDLTFPRPCLFHL